MAQLGLEDAAALFLLRACSSWQVTHWHTVSEIAQGVCALAQAMALSPAVLHCPWTHLVHLLPSMHSSANISLLTHS